MDIEIKAPGFPESVADGSIIAWHKQAGDRVKRDEVLVDIETDKVMFEVPAIANGILKEVIAEVGATVVSQQLLAILDSSVESDDVLGEEKQELKKGEESYKNPSHLDRHEDKDTLPVAPAARNLIAKNKLNVSDIKGTGKGGRILKEDVLRYISTSDKSRMGSGEKLNEKTAVLVAPQIPVVGLQPAHDVNGSARERRVPMTRLRARIAERLVEAQHTAAILTTFNEVDMQSIIDLRKTYKDMFEKTHGIKLGFMSFFVKASVEALKRFPAVNASIDGGDIIYHNYFDIGIAVGSPRGLVVPVLRNTETSGLADIERKINEYSLKAKEGTLALEEITGGTFTITNGGVFGSMLSTPILNPPQSAILGMHKIEQRAVVIEGDIVARPMMYLALSYDHRIIDGQEAVQFLVTIKELLEDPARIMLEI